VSSIFFDAMLTSPKSVALHQIFQSLEQLLWMMCIAALHALETLNICVAQETFCPTILLLEGCTITCPVYILIDYLVLSTRDGREFGSFQRLIMGYDLGKFCEGRRLFSSQVRWQSLFAPLDIVCLVVFNYI